MNKFLADPLQETLEKFLRLSTAEGAARPRTLAAYRDAIRYYATWAAAAGVDPLTASHEDILTYRNFMVSAYKRTTIRLRLTSVRLFYRALQRWGSRPDNPAEGVKAPKMQENAASSVLTRGLPPAQAKALLEAAGDDRNGAMLRLMLLHGLRVGEVAALTLDDLSPCKGRLSVPGKGGKRRTLVLAYQCRQNLATATPGALFKGRGGGPLTVRSIERAVNQALTAAGIKEKGKSCHSLRHGFGVLAAIGGARPEAISEAMGHADLKTTGVYTRAAWAYLENPTDAVERALGRRSTAAEPRPDLSEPLGSRG